MKKFFKEKHTDSEYFAKLVEEVGEVAEALIERSARQVLAELMDVERVVVTWRKDLEQKVAKSGKG